MQSQVTRNTIFPCAPSSSLAAALARAPSFPQAAALDGLNRQPDRLSTFMVVRFLALRGASSFGPYSTSRHFPTSLSCYLRKIHTLSHLLRPGALQELCC